MASRKSPRKAPSSLGAPYLRSIRSDPERMNGRQFPFSIPAFSRGIALDLPNPVTFFVGENGSGKSTLLEALAEICGFNPEGGNRDHFREGREDRSELAQALKLSWMPKMTEGFFMRVVLHPNLIRDLHLKMTHPIAPEYGSGLGRFPGLHLLRCLC